MQQTNDQSYVQASKAARDGALALPSAMQLLQMNRVLESKAVLIALALTILVTCLCVYRMKEANALPQGVAVRGELSKADAASLYTSNNRMLHTLFRRRVRANVGAGQFKEAWLNVRRGPERIHTVSKEAAGWFVVSATNRLGNACSIRTRQLFVSPDKGAWVLLKGTDPKRTRR